MDIEHSEKVIALRRRVQDFMDSYVLPANPEWHAEARQGRFPLQLIGECKELAKEEGLWNLFLPSLAADEPGQRLTHAEYAPLAEIMGRIPWAAEIFNCSAPDTGNMEMLKTCATAEQYERWLRPLLEGEIRSAFAMSEPDVASSDPTNLQTSITRDGTDFIINGRKWFVTGAAHPECRVVLVMGLSPHLAATTPHARHTLLAVPMDTPGLQVVRNISVMQHLAPEGHCELLFRNVRVPASCLLGQEGQGFQLAQARLGPGRIHHCMRSIGQCELALELMCERALERKSFGRYLADYANIQEWIAESRLEIDQARLLVLHTASLLDRVGNQAARVDVSAIKVVAARMQTRVLDRAIQVFGAMGLGPETPLGYLWTWGRALRILDGPDEVHLRAIAKKEIARARENHGAGLAYLTPFA